MDFRKTNLDAFQKKHGLKLGFMSAFLKASAYALQDQPVVNAVIEGNEIIYRDYVDISVAVATPKVKISILHNWTIVLYNILYIGSISACRAQCSRHELCRY